MKKQLLYFQPFLTKVTGTIALASLLSLSNQAYCQLDTVIARGQNVPNEGLNKLYDGDLQSKWLDFSATSWVQFSYKTAVIWNTVVITSGNDFPERDPKDWLILGSNDSIQYDTLIKRTNDTRELRFQSRTFAFANIKAYKFYKWAITANGGGEIIQASELTFSFNPKLDVISPTKPTKIAIKKVLYNSASLSWSPSVDAGGVSYYKIFANGIFNQTAEDTLVQISGLTHATTYKMFVIAYDSSGNASIHSDTVAFTTKKDTVPPTVPKVLKATNVAFTSLTLSWNASIDSAGIKSYQVFKDGVSVGNTVAPTIDITNLLDSTMYSFYVIALDSSGLASLASDTLKIKTPKDTVVRTSSILISSTGNLTSVSIGDTLKFLAIILPSNAADKVLKWVVENGTGSATIDSTGKLVAKGVGMVTVKAKANSDTTIISNLFVLEIKDTLTAVMNGTEILKAQLMPNPATDVFYVVIPDGNLEVQAVVYNDRGVAIYNEKYQGTSSIKMDLTGHAAGLYLVSLRSGNALVTKKLILK